MSVTFNASTTSGIGITSDNSGDIQFQSNAANTVIINSSGQVGIGTASPASIFNVYSSSFASALIQGDAATNVTVNRSSTDASGPAFNLRKARGTTSAQTAVASGDALGTLNFQAYGGTNLRSVIAVQGFVDTYVSDTNISSYLTFSTSPAGSASVTERMRIDSSGNVGIGTASPSSRLNVSQSSTDTALYYNGARLTITNSNTTANNFDTLSFTTANGNDAAAIWTIIGSHTAAAATGTLVFGTSNSAAASTERMRIDSSGNVGIGTNNPQSLLHIASSTLYAPNVFIENAVSNAAPAYLTFQKARGSLASKTAVSNGDDLGTVSFNGYDGTNYIGGCFIAGFVDGVVSTGVIPSGIRFIANSAERMRINSSGYAFINETATVGTASWLTITAAASSVYGATIKDSGTTYATTTRYMNFVNSTNAVAGSIQHTAATTTAFSTSSDARLKKNIVDAPSAIDIITNIPVRSYDWKEDNSHVKFGFVAQELGQVYEEPVGVGGDDVNSNPWSIEYGRMTPILVKALQELKAEFDAYKATHP